MAGFDLDTQRSFAMHGMKGECGHVAFTADTYTLAVPTAMNTVFMAFGIIETDTTDGNHSLVCTASRTVAAAGTITFTRHCQYNGDAPVMSYVIFGW